MQVPNDFRRHPDGGVAQPRSGVFGSDALDDAEDRVQFGVPDRRPAEAQSDIVAMQYELSIVVVVGGWAGNFELPGSPASCRIFG